MKSITHNVTVFKTILTELGKEANKQFPTLNVGGCCVFAAEVARQLQKHGVEVEVITPRGYGDDAAGPIDKVRTNLLDNGLSPLKKDNWNREGASFWHVAIRFHLNGKWYTYDSNKLRCSKDKFGATPPYTARSGSHTVEEAIAFAKDRHGWNTRFDRKQIPAVKKLVAQYLN